MENMMTSLHLSQSPTVIFKSLDDFSAVHGGYYNYPIKTITTIPTHKMRVPRERAVF
jgi:hypothetical protein